MPALLRVAVAAARRLSPRRLLWRRRARRQARRPYELDVRQAIARIVQPGWVCADVGAYVGVLTRDLAAAAGSTGRVVAFEAHPPTAHALREALAAEGYGDRVRVEHVAVTDGSEPLVALYGGRGDLPSEWNVVGHDLTGAPTEPVAEVDAVSLDHYFAPGSRLDFVKIDVEGAEGLVLVGMERLLREVRPVLLIEFHDEEGWSARRRLLAAGYRLADLRGRELHDGAGRVYHCLGLPS